MTKAVLDTNVLVAALKSRAGASFRVSELVVVCRLTDRRNNRTNAHEITD